MATYDAGGEMRWLDRLYDSKTSGKPYKPAHPL
jgi:hypothetical protein